MSRPFRLTLINRDAQLKAPERAALAADGAEASGETRVMQGYATLYNTKTDLYFYSLSIDPGAFHESLARGDDIVSLFNHDWNYVLGRTPKTLRIDDSHAYGLYQETDLPQHELGKRILEDIQRGALTQQSVSFYIEEYEYTDGDREELSNFHVTKARLEDVSAVTFGQYPQTTLEIKKLYAEKNPAREFFEKLLAQKFTGKEISQSLDRSLEIQQYLQDQRKRKLRGILEK